MKRRKVYPSILAFILCLTFAGCDDNIDDVVEEMKLSRVLAPTELTARIRTLTTIELVWNVREGADHYVVEFSEDSLEFNTIIFTDEVTVDELPYQHVFDGETRYSARVKAVSAEGQEDSKWAQVTIVTAAENIFLPMEDGDIEAVTTIVRWPENSDVTHFVINPGNVERTISAGEKAAGIATIAGLTGETNYTVILRKGTKQRGSIQFTTLIDVGDATRVYATDNLSDVIAAATSGDVLVLYPGDYTVFTGLIALNKSISIKGLYPNNKPMIHAQFTLANGATDVELKDLDIDGDGTMVNVLEYTSAGVNFGSLVINGCNIHDYTARLVYGNVASKLASLSINNSIMTNVDAANGGDFIDFRLAHVTSVSITNSTFVNCAPGRDFVRLDAAAGYTGTGLTSTVAINHCTFSGVSNTQDRILYVRFNANSLSVQNSLFASTDGYYSNQAATTQPTCTNNNYFSAVGFYTPAYVTGAKIDVSGNHTTLDPGFVNAAGGNFTITNQALIDNAVGDPRWRP